MGSKERFYVDLMAVHQEVTGSCHLAIVKYPDGTTIKFLVDCGLFQEREYGKYNNDLPFDAANIDFCLVTHNHVDHTGRLPLLVKRKFSNKIYSTSATACLIDPALDDSYRVLKDLAKRNHERELYSESDANNAKNLFVGCGFEETIQIDESIKATFFKNGHLVGAALILVQISYPECEDINLLFTGDYNDHNMFFDVPPLPEWVLDLPLTVIQESTYGNMDTTEIKPCFEKNVFQRIRDGGSVLGMAFSLGRSQEVLYVLKTMQNKGDLSREIPIYFDGKLAHRYTSLYLKADLGIREDMKDFLPANLNYVDRSNRMSVIESSQQKIIITTSGMGSYGPAQVYIPNLITQRNYLLQFTGYTTEGTLGSRLKETEVGQNVNIGSIIRTKLAEVAYTTEFSAHAKADEMIAFLKRFRNLKLVLVNHGEAATKEKFSERIVGEVDPKCVAISNRDYFFRVSPYGMVRSMSTKFD